MIRRGMISPLRRISSSTTTQFKSQNILNQFKDQEVNAPSKLAEESSLPRVHHDLNITPKAPKYKRPFLSENKIENEPGYKMGGFKQMVGQAVVKLFNVDMDKSRAGPVAGSIYYGECKKQGMIYPNETLSPTAKFYYETLDLPRSFSQWFQITILHYWILSTRMRALPFKYGRNYQQKLVDRLFRDMELRMAEELGINSNRLITGYLKDYHSQMIGCVLSYDEGLMTDDITFAAALWRNVFNGNPNVDMRHVEALLGYVRSQLYVLNKMTDREFGFGYFNFVPPDQVVKPLTKAQEQELKERVKLMFEEKTLPSQRSSLSLDE